MKNNALSLVFLLSLWLCLFLSATLIAGCNKSASTNTDNSTDENTDPDDGNDSTDTSDGTDDGNITVMEFDYGGYDGVDLLMVVDNSVSMEKEQEILANALFSLINTLTNPADGSHWPFDQINNMRIAVVSTDMAFSAGGEEYDHDDAEVQWPHPISALANCWDNKMGDGGRFLDYDNDLQVLLESDKFVCDDESQCPTDWSCTDERCQSPSGDDEAVDCPGLGTIFTETTAEEPYGDFALQTACMVMQGTQGCGIEQQLQAGVHAFSDDNEHQKYIFVKDSHLLAYLIVTDEEDCSLKDVDSRNAFFESPDIENQKRINVACGDQASDWLLTAKKTKELYSKPKVKEDGVIFAAIVGVPPKDVCQTTGDKLGDCLGEDDMQYKEIALDNEMYQFEYACTNGDDTQAIPGRRFVQVAQEFGEMGYVSSICNPDWTPAMHEFGKLLAQNLGIDCFTKQLPWDEDRQTSVCEMVVTIDGVDACPHEYEEGGEVITLPDGSVQARCILPKLNTPLNCSESQIDPGEFGWFYCENAQTENFAATCNDNLDNDNNGSTDCDDDACSVCCDNNGFNEALPTCQNKCLYHPGLTAVAQDATRGKKVEIECLIE